MSKIAFEAFYEEFQDYARAVMGQVERDCKNKIPETEFLRNITFSIVGHKTVPEYLLEKASIEIVSTLQGIFPKSNFLKLLRGRQQIEFLNEVLGLYHQNGDTRLETRFEPPATALKEEFAQYAERALYPHIAHVIREGMKPEGVARQKQLAFT